MTELKKYWMRLPADGTVAQIDGAVERDRLVPLGWEEADEPAATDFVWMRKDGIEQPARFAYGAAEDWRRQGWEFSAPPEHIDPTRDPAVAEPVKPAASTEPKSTATGAKATAAEKKE
jgi:hypothetical protein